jgi:hypothetical protein
MTLIFMSKITLKEELASILDEIYTDPNGIEIDEMLADILKVVTEHVEELKEREHKKAKKEFYNLLCNSEGSSLSASQYRRWHMDEFSLEELL